jgi:putative restriction endonuclease
VRLGWVVDHDDSTKQFLILFGPDRPDYAPSPDEDDAFQLEGPENTKTATVRRRDGQQRFRFQVFAKYGCKCAVCSVEHPSLMKAAHIRGKANRGSDDWRNGLPLCSTHHDAFDAHLFLIDPATLVFTFADGIIPERIGIEVDHLVPLRAHQPHRAALEWRKAETMKQWEKV